MDKIKVGIWQPYFLPYIGYFQLISMVDKFVIYDNIEYTKKGWINRNRFLCNGTDKLFTLSLKKDSDYLNVAEREISNQFDKKKLLNQLEMSYKKAPYFTTNMPIINEIITYEESNLFRYIFHSVQCICKMLDIDTEIIVSSSVRIDHSLKGQDKVLAFCERLDADTYINSIGGIALYNRDEFKKRNIDLLFFKCNDIVYSQFNNEFVSNLSIIDVMMFNSTEEIKKMLTQYTIL